MKLNHNDAAVRADSINARTGSSSAGEIDLYDELTAFAELSPDEQMSLVDRPEKTSTEIEKTSAEEVEEEHPSPEPLLEPAPIEPVEAEKTPAETEKISAEKAERHPSPEPVLALAPIEPVEAEATALPAESASDAADSYASVERNKVRPELFVRPSGPLGSLTRGFVFTGALSRGVCLACGAESDADDLFCITCGVFIDEIGSTLPVKPTCAECKQRIAPDEIFCPWCGSVLPAA
jgi:Double zinc ribbon